MKNLPRFVNIHVLFVFIVLCNQINGLPVSQPAYEQPQYITAQSIPSYKNPNEYNQHYGAQQTQRVVRPVYEAKAEGLGQYQTRQQQPQTIQTVLLASNADRQIQKSAQQSNGPVYLQQVLAAQQQGLGQEAIAAAQRKATSTSLRRLQPIPVPAVPIQSEQTQLYQPQVRYVPRASTAETQQYARIQQQQLDREPEGRKVPEDDFDPNPSYQFGFDVKDDQFTNYQNRKETRDGNKITGSYSVVDADGYIRTVQYTADPKEGFKAEVTREPTDIKIKIPKPEPKFQNVPRQAYQEQPQYIQEAAPQQARQQYAEPQQYTREQYQQARPANVVYRYE